MKIFFYSFLIAVCLLSKISFCQNIGISTDGSTPETGVLLDIKGANSKTSTTVLQNIFQIKSFDASTDALKLRLGLATNSGTPANQYGVIDVPEYSGGSVSAYRNLALQPLGGNVGIGTTNPASHLEVLSTISTVPRGVLSSQYTTDNVGGAFVGRKARNTAASPAIVASGDFLTGFLAQGYDGAAYQGTGQAAFIANGTMAAGSIPTDFVVYTGSTGFGTEKIRVTSAGNVGIGATNPGDHLHILFNNNASEGMIVQNQNSGTSADTRILMRNDASIYAGFLFGSSTFNIYARANGLAVGTYLGGGDLGLFTANVERMTITNVGNVGIGINTPDINGATHIMSTATNSTKWCASNFGADLIIGSPGVRNPAICMLDASSTNPFAICNAAGNLYLTRMPTLGDAATQQSFDFSIRTNGDVWVGTTGGNPAYERSLYVSKNVGIGTSTPTSKLQIVGLPVYANNAAAITGGLTAGALYTTGVGDPRPVYIVY